MARSFLFIPGNVPRMLQNLDVFEADTIIVDLEDAIAYEEKDEARELTRAFFRAHPPHQPVYVRINTATQAMFEEDLHAIKDLPVRGIVLPKTTVKSLEETGAFFDEASINFDIIALIETPDAFFSIERIAANPRVKGLLLGGEDLTSATGSERTLEGQEILFARSQVILASKAHDKTAIDTPWTTMDDRALKRDTALAKTLGFDAKCAIHPNQVPTINSVLSPDPRAILQARRILAMHRKEGSMRFALDGKMIDKPVIERARKLLERAEKYGLLEGDRDDTR